MSHIWPFNVQFIWYYVCASEEGMNESPFRPLEGSAVDLDLILEIQSTAGFISFKLVQTAAHYTYLQCQVQIGS